MNFINAFNEGQEGNNVGLNMGIEALNRAVAGLQKKRQWAVAAGPKVKNKFSFWYSSIL